MVWGNATLTSMASKSGIVTPLGASRSRSWRRRKKRSIREQFAILELDGAGEGEDGGNVWPELDGTGEVDGDVGAKRRRVDTAGHYAASGSAGPDAPTPRRGRRHSRRHWKAEGEGKGKDELTAPLLGTPNGMAPPSPKPLPAGVHVRMRLRAPTPTPPPKPHHPKQPKGPPSGARLGAQAAGRTPCAWCVRG